MAGKTHPYLDAVIFSAFIFFTVVFMIILIALYIRSVVVYEHTLPAAVVEKNITPPGQLYSRQDG